MELGFILWEQLTVTFILSNPISSNEFLKHFKKDKRYFKILSLRTRFWPLIKFKHGLNGLYSFSDDEFRFIFICFEDRVSPVFLHNFGKSNNS